MTIATPITPEARPARIRVRSATYSDHIVETVRDELFERRLRPGDFLGTEKDLAARFGVSRIVARDALRTLAASGVVEIRVGAGGGATIASGNPELFAQALSVQLHVMGARVSEIMDAQRAIECATAELAAERASAAENDRLVRVLAEAEASIGDMERFTRASQRFHLAIAEAAHNRVLLAQLRSLQHVAWPRRNPTLTPVVARHIQTVHEDIARLIAAGDAEGARRAMSGHVALIRERRMAESGETEALAPVCC